jgi:hypothetical protein
MNNPAQSIARQLAAVGDNGAFATHFSMVADPQLQVDGVDVSLPVTHKTAHRLCAVAEPAMHGYKDQTRLDSRVRDTWEIAGRRLRFGSTRWTAALDRAVLRISRDLGLPPQSELRAELHNLLVYAPGQFFSVHQDSEKIDGMLGTLVITLPSRFSGGEFVVVHHGQTVRARGSASRLDLVAFYADCHHEVRPVTHGYRVVLTYNLIARGCTAQNELSAKAVKALARDLCRFWQTPRQPRWAHDDVAGPPDRLVYLLDHQYTPSSLSWERLKGVDAARAAALRQAAEHLDALVYLALADVHETWSAEDSYRQHDYWEDSEDDNDAMADESAHSPTLTELINSDIELRHWLAPDDSPMKVDATGVDIGELCMNRLSEDCTPFRSEYEGYMGNYGNTVDRWYHRAAVVIWPRERDFTIRARQTPGWAMAQIAGQFRCGNQAKALEWVRCLLPDWRRSVAGTRDVALFGVTLAVAAELDDAMPAATLLAPFSLQQLVPETDASTLRLLERHGAKWFTARLRGWAESSPYSEEQIGWIEKALPRLARIWHDAGPEGRAVATALTQDRWEWLRRHIAGLQAHTSGSARTAALEATSGAVLGLVRASHAARAPKLGQEVIGMLLSGELPPQLPLRVLRRAHQTVKASANLLADVHQYCVRVCEACLARPARPADDWSIVVPAQKISPDALDAPLRQFLAAPARQRMEWPLAAEKRQLIHQYIERHELPLHHETRRSGRPFTLVLQKTQALFQRDAAERLRWRKDRDWLQRVAERFV